MEGIRMVRTPVGSRAGMSMPRGFESLAFRHASRDGSQLGLLSPALQVQFLGEVRLLCWAHIGSPGAGASVPARDALGWSPGFPLSAARSFSILTMDHRELAELYARCGYGLYRRCLAYLGNEAEAQDAV